MRVPKHVRGRASGFSLLEVIVAMSVFAVASTAFLQVIFALQKSNLAGKERTLATKAAESMIEQLLSEDATVVFARYNDSPWDDPGAMATAPGPDFDAAGLIPLKSDPDRKVGKISFPMVGAQLREDVVDEALGMPRDLNGDGVIDAADHSGDYRILPVTITLEWSGVYGPQKLVFKTLLTKR